ncbi:hypothetical protein TNCV_1512331 [Trichonephila clavipes]|nr:hypothetical protein TNCV_1512331 [Trichonephila clavipes]
MRTRQRLSRNDSSLGIRCDSFLRELAIMYHPNRMGDLMKQNTWFPFQCVRHDACEIEVASLASYLERCHCWDSTDEAHFWLNGYVNKQNCRIWSEANPQVYVETPLHPEKLTVWCALWAGGILLQKR